MSHGKSSAAHVFSRREDARATRKEQEQYTRQSKAHGSFCDGVTSKVDVLQSARVLPAHVVAPFNAQSTLWAYSGFWGLLLPISVHGRVSDIWRSYIMQRVMADAGLHVAFSDAWVEQHRSQHNYLADLQAEDHLYHRSGALHKFLSEWTRPFATHSLPETLEALYRSLYEVGVIEIDDLRLMQEWLKVLVAAGYTFPSLS